jgi:3-isopropylmalate/(R)-2-methylmalate dehydratase small subunit
MKPFITHRGVVATLDRVNVDTDQIIPKQFLKRIERTGFGQFLFYDWRFEESGEPNPDFELNRPNVAGATILVTRANFGCGSSREHAPWALADYGFRAIVAPSFADIFYNNCFKNGLLAIELSEAVTDDIFSRARAGKRYELSIDLERQVITDDTDLHCSFSIEPFKRNCLLHGLDEIGLTLKYEDEIREFEKKRSALLNYRDYNVRE